MKSALSASSAATTLLYVDDDENAAFLFRLSLEQVEPATRLFIVETCQKALKFLRRQAPFEEAPRPQLVVLDLHLPDGTGIYFLENIRSDAQLSALLTVFFSTTRLISHRKRAAELGAPGFFLKPPDLAEFEQAVESIHSLAPSPA